MTQKAACLTAVRTYGDKKLREGMERGFSGIEMMREVKRLTVEREELLSERDKLEDEVTHLTRENSFLRGFIADKNRVIGEDSVARLRKTKRRKRSDNVEAAAMLLMFFLVGAFGAFAAFAFVIQCGIPWTLW